MFPDYRDLPDQLHSCAVCGDKKAIWRPGIRKFICDADFKGMPDKLLREEFDPAYWGDDYEKVPEGIRREFYEDYQLSTCTLEEYIDRTTEVSL